MMEVFFFFFFFFVFFFFVFFHFFFFFFIYFFFFFIFFFFFLFCLFLLEIAFNYSCKVSPYETICMKFQSLFSEKKNIINVSSA